MPLGWLVNVKRVPIIGRLQRPLERSGLDSLQHWPPPCMAHCIYLSQGPSLQAIAMHCTAYMHACTTRVTLSPAPLSWQ